MIICILLSIPEIKHIHTDVRRISGQPIIAEQLHLSSLKMHKIPHKAIAFGIRELHQSPYRPSASTHLKSNVITFHNAEDILKA